MYTATATAATGKINVCRSPLRAESPASSHSEPSVTPRTTIVNVGIVAIDPKTTQARARPIAVRLARFMLGAELGAAVVMDLRRLQRRLPCARERKRAPARTLPRQSRAKTCRRGRARHPPVGRAENSKAGIPRPDE